MKKTPRRVAFDAQRAQLSRLESFVLSRVDGQLSTTDLVDLTGLAAPQVEQIISKLASRGAIELAEAPSAPQLDELLEDEPLANVLEVVDEVPGAIQELPAPDSWVADKMPEPQGPTIELASQPRVPAVPPSEDSQLELVSDDDWEAPPDAPDPAYALDSDSLAEDDADASGERPEAGEEKKQQPQLVPAEGDVTDPEAVNAAEMQNYRKLYESTLRHLPADERLNKARMDSGAVLFAMCFDQDPTIINALLENDRMSLDHARLIANVHRNPVGLDALCQRVSILKDARVQRMLLRNTQLTEILMRKILMPKRLIEIYKASNDRDIPDRTRGSAKQFFKGKFSNAAPEEKFEIIWNTEGRVLPALLGQTIDQKTTALFCARNFTSVMLIQAFARFPATPPGILSHMLRQPLVRRQVHLRNMILQHPNVPSEVKRKV